MKIKCINTCKMFRKCLALRKHQAKFYCFYYCLCDYFWLFLIELWPLPLCQTCSLGIHWSLLSPQIQWPLPVPLSLASGGLCPSVLPFLVLHPLCLAFSCLSLPPAVLLLLWFLLSSTLHTQVFPRNHSWALSQYSFLRKSCLTSELHLLTLVKADGTQLISYSLLLS